MLSNAQCDSFAREVKFEDIRNIDKVYPAILNTNTFFDMEILRRSMTDLVGFSDNKIKVYFDIKNLAITSNKENWWELLQEFEKDVVNFPAGRETKYYYGEGKSCRTSPIFCRDKKPYQAFINLFDNSLQAFSCLVNENPNKLSFTSRRSNYETIKPGEFLIDDNKTKWEGMSKTFLDSASILFNAFKGKERKYIQEYGNADHDIRIIYPERGALVSHLYDTHGVTLYVNNDSIEKLISK